MSFNAWNWNQGTAGPTWLGSRMRRPQQPMMPQGVAGDSTAVRPVSAPLQQPVGVNFYNPATTAAPMTEGVITNPVPMHGTGGGGGGGQGMHGGGGGPTIMGPHRSAGTWNGKINGAHSQRDMTGLADFYKLNPIPSTTPAASPQQNFEAWQAAHPGEQPSAAMQAQAQQFGAAYGQNFDPSLGYRPQEHDPEVENNYMGDTVELQRAKAKRNLLPMMSVGGDLAKNQEAVVGDSGKIYWTPLPGMGPQPMPVPLPGPPEMFVPSNGSQPILLDKMQVFKAPTAGTVLSNPELQRLSALRNDGITPLGGGDAVMQNRYGSGFATGTPRPMGTAPYFADPKTNVQIKPTSAGFLPVPDIVPDSSPWHSAAGLPANPEITREAIAASMANAAPRMAAVNALNPSDVAASLALTDPNKELKEKWQANAYARAVADTAAQRARLAAANAPKPEPIGMGPGGLFSPAQMARAKEDAQRMANSSAGRAHLAQWTMQQPNTDIRFAPIPGSDYGVPFVGNRAFGTLPFHQPHQQQGVRALTADDGTVFYFGPDGKQIKPQQPKESKPATQKAYKLDEIGGKATHVIDVPEGKLPPPGYDFFEDKNGDGIPDPPTSGTRHAPSPTSANNKYFPHNKPI